MNFTNSQCLSALCLNVGDYLKSGLQTEVQTGSAIDSTAVLAGHRGIAVLADNRGKVCEFYSARFCDPSLSYYLKSFCQHSIL